MKETALKEHVRLTILRLLNEMPSGFCNASLMTDGLRDMCLDVNRAFIWHDCRGARSLCLSERIGVMV